MRTLRRSRNSEQANLVTLVVAFAEGEEVPMAGLHFDAADLGGTVVQTVRRGDSPDLDLRPRERVYVLEVISLETHGRRIGHRVTEEDASRLVTIIIALVGVATAVVGLYFIARSLGLA